MKTETKQEGMKVLTDLLSEARLEADRLRERIKKYESVLLSTNLLMGHELKKPATAITGYIDLAIDTLESSRAYDTNDVMELLRKARKECQLLVELNTTFLALLKMGRDKERLPIQRINLAHLVDEIIGEFPPKYGASERVEVRIEMGAQYINFNLNALRLIISNVIENALLYSSRRTRVVIEAGRGVDKRKMSDKEMVKIKVKDNGDGIPPEYLKKIFDPFVRAHQGRVEGSGLGLTLVRSLVELHGGEISINSRKGRGTVVYLMLPLLNADESGIVL